MPRFRFLAIFIVTFLAPALLAQNPKPPPEVVAEPEPVRAENLVPYTEVSKAEMDAWPVDKRQVGEKRWGESTFGMGEHGTRKLLFSYNIWPNRAVLRVQENSAAVTADVPWRRSKLFIRLKGLKILDGKTGAEIRDAELVQYNQERAVVRFSPASGPGLYYLYYGADEPAPRFTPSKEFQKAAGESRAIARVERIEARSPLDNFWPMEVAATKAETDNLLARHPDAPYLIFPEDRQRPIKMVYDIPVHWAMNGPRKELVLPADRNEYRVFQLGLWTCRSGLEDVKTSCSPLVSVSGATIPVGSLQCLTLESHIKSLYILKPPPTYPVPQGQVRALWFGIDLPENIEPGEYQGTITIIPKGHPETAVPIRLVVSNSVVPERGDHDLWRMARLRWIESDAGLTGKVYPPFTPLKLDESRREIASWGHTLRLDTMGLPVNISYRAEDILAEPFKLSGLVDGRAIQWSAPSLAFTETAEDHVSWRGKAAAGSLALQVDGRIEFDGIIVLDLKLTSAAEQKVNDLLLQGTWRGENAQLASGMGYRGRCEGDRLWHRIPGGVHFGPQIWLGSVKAGLAFHTWETAPWEDPSRIDAMTLTHASDNAHLRLNLGGHAITPERPWTMRFALQPTPVKPQDKRHWQFRYLHRGGGFWPSDEDTPQSYLKDNCRRLQDVKELGVKRLNLHDWWGPAFNCAWQWEGPDNLVRLTEEAHKRGMFVKCYNSGRELSSLNPDFWGLVYIGTQYVFPAKINPTPVGTFQDAWLEGHLPDGIPNNWPRLEGRYGNEHSIPVSNATRNGNYYLESMRYMTRFIGTDGAYWDGADGPTLGHREMARRLWTIFQETNPQATIDAHHGDTLLTSPITDNMVCFPFIDSIWHGEGFPYDTFDPWTWLVEISGLPFNVPGEMLGGEPYLARGMLFGIWVRAGWGAGVENPKKLWTFFDRFGIEEAAMRGFWDGTTGVTVDRPDIYTTTFTHPKNGVLVVVASWHPPVAAWLQTKLDVSLLLDRAALGLRTGSLQATDILTGETIDLTRPVEINEKISGRLIWIRSP